MLTSMQNYGFLEIYAHRDQKDKNYQKLQGVNFPGIILNFTMILISINPLDVRANFGGEIRKVIFKFFF